MEKLNELITNDLLLYIKQMEIDYEVHKTRLVTDFDKLIEMENQYAKANQILVDRLKK